MSKRWLVSRTNKEFVDYLSETAVVSPAMAQVLINRGIKTLDAVNDFISASITTMPDPMAMQGVKEAVEAIESVRSTKKKVFVHGDYDVDGVTATAIMVLALRRLGIETEYFIPNRFAHGYGFSPLAVSLAKDYGASLIVTVDCGVTSFEAVETARKQGIGVVVTDHHEAQTEGGRIILPHALAIVNPKLSYAENDPCPSGAGVALKLISALGLPIEDYTDLAALGTLADVVPLLGENRVIVKEGLEMFRNGTREGLKALKTVSGLDGREIKSSLLSYTILPRINAAGRIAEAGEVVELLTSDSPERAKSIAEELSRKNTERQKIEEVVLREAMEQLAGGPEGGIIALAGEGWHEGVIGIVASKLAERFGRPTFIFSKKDGVLKGSARSIPGLDLHRAITACGERLISFGGHKQAAGLRMKIEEFEAFKAEVEAEVASLQEDYTPSISIDATIAIEEVSFSLVRELETLEPFGYANEEPFFGCRGLEVIKPRIVGNNHLKLKLRHKNRVLEAIGFDMGKEYEEMEEPRNVDAVFTLGINEWEGSRILQANVKGLRASE